MVNGNINVHLDRDKCKIIMVPDNSNILFCPHYWNEKIADEQNTLRIIWHHR